MDRDKNGQVALLDAFEKGFAQLQHARSLCLIYDGDADGLSAGTLTRHALDKLFPKLPIIEHTSGARHFFPKDLIDRCAEAKVDTFLVLDLDPINYGEYHHVAEVIFDLLILED